MKTEIITYILGPIVSLVVGWFGSKRWDKNVQRKENMDALRVQEKEIASLYIQLVDIRKNGRQKIKELQAFYEDELSGVRKLLNVQSKKIAHYRENCNCPEDEQTN